MSDMTKFNTASSEVNDGVFVFATKNLIRTEVANALSDITDGVLKHFKNEEGPAAEVYYNIYNLFDAKVKELRGEIDDDELELSHDAVVVEINDED